MPTIIQTCGTLSDWAEIARLILSGKRKVETESQKEAYVIGLRGFASQDKDCEAACQKIDPERKYR